MSGDDPSAAAFAGSRQRRLDALWPRRGPAVMAILNCTPDSFSDGGAYLDPGAAMAGAEEMLAAGADVVDVGGESTRPGAQPVDADEERRRVLPVISELRRRRPAALIAVDTSKVAVAAAALAAGADVVNDVTAAAAPGMLERVAESSAAIVLMHMRGNPRTMQHDTGYRDVVVEVQDYLARRAQEALAAGIPRHRVWLDPGIGFGKDVDGNLALLAALPRLAELGHPLVVGPSRKGFIGRLTGAPVSDRLPGTLAALLPALDVERIAVRVHEPGPVRQFLDLALALREVRA